MINPFFMFATGIENSIPTIQGGRVRVDEMEKCRFYQFWRTDFDLVADLGIGFLRYGPPLHTTYLGVDRYDWSFADETFARLRELDLVPIADLCHFGVPAWIGNFQNPDFPQLFAGYARAFAERYPWVQLYTPVNEMFVCATFSGLYGWWNEQLASDRGFVTALKHLVKANVLAMAAILDVRPDAIFIQSESSEYFHADSPAAIRPAEIRNARRFLSLDLNFGLHGLAAHLLLGHGDCLPERCAGALHIGGPESAEKTLHWMGLASDDLSRIGVDMVLDEPAVGADHLDRVLTVAVRDVELRF